MTNIMNIHETKFPFTRELQICASSIYHCPLKSDQRGQEIGCLLGTDAEKKTKGHNY